MLCRMKMGDWSFSVCSQPHLCCQASNWQRKVEVRSAGLESVSGWKPGSTLAILSCTGYLYSLLFGFLICKMSILIIVYLIIDSFSLLCIQHIKSNQLFLQNTFRIHPLFLTPLQTKLSLNME